MRYKVSMPVEIVVEVDALTPEDAAKALHETFLSSKAYDPLAGVKFGVDNPNLAQNAMLMTTTLAGFLSEIEVEEI